jgi:hypothetical protein
MDVRGLFPVSSLLEKRLLTAQVPNEAFKG